ncbi:MAG: AI-2E family transporter [bacterium]
MQSPITRFFVIGACFVIIVAGMQAAGSFLAPTLFAVLLTIAVLPVIKWLERRRFPTWAAVFTVVLTVVASGVVLIGFVTASVVRLADELPAYQAKFTAQYATLSAWLGGFGVQVPQKLPPGAIDPNDLLTVVGRLLRTFAEGSVMFLIILLLFVVFSIELPRVARLINAKIGNDTALKSRLKLLGSNITGYFNVRALNNFIVSTTLTLLFWALGIDLAILWGVLSFFLGYIPNIGLPLAVLPAFLLAWFDRGIGVAAAVLIGAVVINFISDNILTPKLAGKALNMSMTAVFLSFLFWSWVLGPIGALISVPLTSLLMAGLDCFDETRWIADILSAGKMTRFEPEPAVETPAPAQKAKAGRKG